mmetsp:Transcript_30638/g.74585  ORF Transcript_30638/g.74585 Transcript_30638/m.74585 type:complete len:208 (+) Transcript_30638:3-626(+)
MSTQELEDTRQRFRNATVGVLVSSIKSEWKNLYGDAFSNHMSFHKIRKLKSLLEEEKGMGIMVCGTGGYTRVCTTDHAQKYCRPFPPPVEHERKERPNMEKAAQKEQQAKMTGPGEALSPTSGGASTGGGDEPDFGVVSAQVQLRLQGMIIKELQSGEVVFVKDLPELWMRETGQEFPGSLRPKLLDMLVMAKFNLHGEGDAMQCTH